ncbi:MAG: bifunctional protein HldE [Leptospirillum sp. Group IV 'UBA BS']|jgi:3-deoxy-D-manno-octulosonate 8-phosphate phosphatase, YrbI family|nr:MAG: bifunctional protein HldE [Leptospirillum sp. Group IV 'UBA BS']
MARIPLAVLRRLPSIRALVLDVDGVLTDGRLSFGPPDELKSFHVRDGHGLALLLRSGFPVGIISGRSGAAAKRRLADLGIRDFFLGIRDKSSALDSLLDRWNLKEKQVAAMGDDVTDLVLLERAGLSIAVSDAHPSVTRKVDWITGAPGGYGAVRQVADALLFVLKRSGKVPGEDPLC